MGKNYKALCLNGGLVNKKLNITAVCPLLVYINTILLSTIKNKLSYIKKSGDEGINKFYSIINKNTSAFGTYNWNVKCAFTNKAILKTTEIG